MTFYINFYISFTGKVFLFFLTPSTLNNNKLQGIDQSLLYNLFLDIVKCKANQYIWWKEQNTNIKIWTRREKKNQRRISSWQSMWKHFK